MKRAPEGASSRSCTSISPSWPSTMARAIARPRPVCRPKCSSSGLTEWNRLKIASRASSGTPGPSSSMRIRTVVSDAGGGDLDQPAGGREADRIVDDVVDRSDQPARHRQGRRPSPCAAGRRRSGHRLFRADAPSHATSCSITGPRSTGSNLARASSASVRAASLMSPISRSSRTTSSLRDVEQLRLQLRILDPVEPVDRRAKRSERVLELVRHVGGEMLDIVHPVPERLAHVARPRARAGRSRRFATAGGAPSPRGRGPAGRGAPRARSCAAGGRSCGRGRKTAAPTGGPRRPSRRTAIGAGCGRSG